MLQLLDHVLGVAGDREATLTNEEHAQPVDEIVDVLMKL